MSIKPLALAAAITLGLTLPGTVQAHMIVEDAYARSASAVAQTGAAIIAIWMTAWSPPHPPPLSGSSCTRISKTATA